MVQVFFHGHGYWFFEHKRSRRTYSIHAYNNTYVLTPILDDEIVCKGSFKTTGYFNLTREDERAYRELESDSIIKDMEIKLVPDSDYHPDCTFNETYEKLEIGASRIKAEDCYFIIDRTKPFDFKVKTPSVLTNIEITAKPETKLNITNKAGIKKRHGKQRHNDALDLLHDALDKIEQDTGKTPEPEELVIYVLGGEFNHPNIQKRDPESLSIKRRKLYLTDGKTLDADGIIERYKVTIFPNKPE